MTGDLNAKCMEWGNSSNNACGNILQNCMHSLDLSCVNDDQPTRRESDSIIDLLVVSPSLIKKVIQCQTLSHEQVRSDHISVLLELDSCRTEGADVREERYCIHDVNWEEWVKISESEFLEFNNRVNDSMDLSILYSDFLGTFRECMDEVVPKKQVKVTGRQKRPPWYNKEV